RCVLSRDTLSQIQERPVSWAGSGRLGNAESVDLTLGVLRTLTRFTQTHFLPLDLTGVAGNETGLAQFAAQGFVVFHQRTGDTVTLNSDVDVELFSVAGQFQRLTHDHACSLATEELIESAVVDGDIASTRTQEHPSGGGFTTASTVVLCHRHSELLLDLEFLGLLGSMRMVGTGVDFHLAVHCPTQGVLGQHAFNSDLNDTLRSTLVQLLEVDALETTRETGVAVVHLVLSLVTSDLNLLGIHDHDVVTGINVRSVLR